MDYVIVYLVIGGLFLLAYQIYFKNEPPVIRLGKRETQVSIVLLWLPLLLIFAGCALAALVVDYFKR